MAYQRWYPPGGASGPMVPTKPWDRVRLGGFVLPCHHAVISVAGVALREDRKGGAGQSGALPTYHGMDPQPVTIDVFFSTVEQANSFANTLPFFAPLPGIPVRVVAIEAQAIDGLPISSVAVHAVSGMIDAAPFKRCTITTRHWMSPQKHKGSATSTPKHDVGNKRAEEDAAKQNPRPTAQPNFCAPNFTPGA